MAVAALVMAGGKGSRMKSDVEKPLTLFHGRPMILYAIEAAENATTVKDVYVAVSPNTPQTSQKMRELGVKVVETLGRNYVADMQIAIKRMALKETLILSADLPLLDAAIIDQIVRYYQASGKPALTVMAPLAGYRRLKLEPDLKIKIDGKTLVPVGVNFINGDLIDQPEVDEEILVMNDVRVLLNVNTVKELQLAEKYYRKLRTPASVEGMPEGKPRLA